LWLCVEVMTELSYLDIFLHQITIAALFLDFLSVFFFILCRQVWYDELLIVMPMFLQLMQTERAFH